MTKRRAVSFLSFYRWCARIVYREPRENAGSKAAKRKEQKKFGGIVITLILAIVPWASGWSVVWKCLGWGIAWILLLYLVFVIWVPRWIGNPSPWAKWLACVVLTVVGVVLVSGPVRNMWRDEKSAALEGDLVGAGETFNDGLARAVPFLQIGDSGTTLILMPQKPGQPVSPYFQFFYDAGFKIEWGKSGPLVTTPIRDRFGNLVVEIKQNHWICHPPYCSDKNYTRDALEVLDSSGHVVFQVKLVRSPMQEVQIQGEWWDNQGSGRRVITVPGGGAVLFLNPQNQQEDKLIKPIFSYPSKGHWGELAKN